MNSCCRCLGILAAFAALLAAAAPARSHPLIVPFAPATGQAHQADQPGQSDFTLDGKIAEMQKGRLTVDTGGNIIFHVTYDAKTEIKRKDGAAGSAKDLQVGAKLHVVGSLSDSGDVVAARINLE